VVIHQGQQPAQAAAHPLARLPQLADESHDEYRHSRKIPPLMRSLWLLLPVVASSCGSVKTNNPAAVDAAVATDSGTGGGSGSGSGSGAPGSPFPSNGSAGPFAPTKNTVLAAGIYQFTTVNIPAGVTITTNGTGVLELRAQGDVTIAGTIDVSGAHGSPTQPNLGSGGGATGDPNTIGADGTDTACPQGGTGGMGALGAATTTGSALCTGTVANTSGGFGGGAGGQFQAGGGAGGGGYAGGGGGRGGAGASMDGTGGAAATSVGLGGQPDGGTYAGANGLCDSLGGCGGGGGSIGHGAIVDLAVVSTFRPGSGGGGGGASAVTQQVRQGGAGGGGGGGALRIASPTAVTIASTGILRADGGAGGVSGSGGGGGGGSGGVIYLAAPKLTVAGTVSAAGGAIDGAVGSGGAGGLGRIRLSATTADCSLTGTFTPPLASACNPTSIAAATYIAAFPN
jgi:hypothetical protein